MSGERCPMCGGLGWILDCNDLGKPGPRQAELLPCLLPDCAASGQPLQSITFSQGPARFTTVTMHPSEGWFMAVRDPMPSSPSPRGGEA